MSSRILTSDERELLIQLARGHTIASLIAGSNKRAIEKKLGSIYRKLGVASMVEAVAQGFVFGIITKEDVPPKAFVSRQGAYRNMTPRERDVLSWKATGLDSRAIAEKLGISRSTVDVYLHTVRHKFGVDTDQEAIALAKLNKLLNEEICSY